MGYLKMNDELKQKLSRKFNFSGENLIGYGVFIIDD